MTYTDMFLKGIQDDVLNICCLFYTDTIDAFEENIWVLLASLFRTLGLRYNGYNVRLSNFLNVLFYNYGQFKPLKVMNTIGIGVGTAYSCFTIGLLGVQNGSYIFHYAYGFSGLKIIKESG